MKRVILGIIILAMITIFLNGCGQAPNGRDDMFKRHSDTDVTAEPKYNFKSFAGTAWKTKVKTVVGDIKAYTGEHHITLLPPSAFDRSHPEYRPPPFLEKVLTELPVGTRLRIERLIRHQGMASFFFVTASYEDRATVALEHAKVIYLDPDFIAKNRFIWEGESDSKEWGVDPDLLEKAQ
jgi:hypothetical protein